MDNEIKISFKSKRCNIAIIRNIVATIIVDENPTISFINEVKTIVSEAVTNAIVHGYKNNENNIIDFEIKTSVEGVFVKIIDYGVGISDVAKAKEPLFTTLESEERSGLGFTIMELFSDEFNVISEINKGTTISFLKKW